MSAETKLPVHWDGRSGIAWKTALPGEGNSSPIVSLGRVYVTCSTDKGRRRHVLCLDAASGRILWKTDLTARRTPSTYPKNGYASSTPCTDGRRVYAFFDSPGLVALDLAGKVLWTADLGPFRTSWNLASSPVLAGPGVFMCCDHDGESFIVALDRATGGEVWRARRDAGRQFSTPLVIEHDGRAQVVVNGAKTVSYDPATGAELWRHRTVKDGSDPTVPTAVYHGSLVYLTSGRNGPTNAVDPGGRGDVTESRVRMHFPTGGPYVPSPLVYPCLFVPNDNGKFLFLDDAGNLLWEDRLRDHFSASPVAGDGKIYWASERGNVYVLDVSGPWGGGAKPNVRLLAVNRMGERCLASPAIAGGRVFVRTKGNLYCVSGDAGRGGADRGERPRLSGVGFDELKARYDAHGAGEGPDVLVRLDVIAAMGECHDARGVGFLLNAAFRESHWDASEEAAKTLLRRGAAAIPAVVEILESRGGRTYLKVIACGHAGELAAAEAAPSLVRLAGDRRPAIRIAALAALARVGRAHEARAGEAVDALVAALGDRLGIVKAQAAEGLALMSGALGERRGEAVRGLKALRPSENPHVSRAAKRALGAIARGSPAP